MRELEIVNGLSALEAAHFWVRVQPCLGEDPCWIWTGKCCNGYGSVWYAHKNFAAHRIAWALVYKTPTAVVRHTCDNPPCVNPLHLLDGTQQDNIRDMIERGRKRCTGRPGEAHHAARLTPDGVRAIRTSTDPLRIIANRHGISRGHVADIRARRKWAHLT